MYKLDRGGGNVKCWAFSFGVTRCKTNNIL